MKPLVLSGDSETLIEEIEDNTFDLIILDPDYQDWKGLCDRGFMDQVLRVLHPTGNIICFTKQPFDHHLRNTVDPWFRREMIWTFSNGGAWVSNKMPLVSFQKMFWLVKSKDFFVNVRTGIDYPASTRSAKRSTKQFGGWVEEGRQFELSPEGTWIRDHYHFNKPHTGAVPSKPEALIRILVNCFSPIHGKVFDPFWGSGTTGRVCHELDRQVLGIEINPDRVPEQISQTPTKENHEHRAD
jgi:DNA modification methylase